MRSSSQRDGGSLASGSGFCGNRVSVVGSPEISLCANQRKARFSAVMARRQFQHRSSALSDSVSRAIFLEFLYASVYQLFFSGHSVSPVSFGLGLDF